jgi:hypothetical protein
MRSVRALPATSSASAVIRALMIRRSSATSSLARARCRGRFDNYSATTRSCHTSATAASPAPAARVHRQLPWHTEAMRPQDGLGGAGVGYRLIASTPDV